ncbi:MAG: hypothetical protein C0606_16905 [Hyphomicrobiales bacterium]|nr:MAG: hypothetical protein C0606_16905 [Hyphomicrobiales bacterium]
MQNTSSVAATMPLRAMRAFEAAARLGSIKDAADALGVTPAAVSRQIQTLEAWLESDLFRRSHNAIELTEAGAALFADISPPLAALAAAARRARRGTNEVVAAIGITFGTRWLIPRLGDLRARHPNMQLRLSTRDTGLAEPPDMEADVEVRYRREPDRHAGDVPLFADHSIPVCGPALHAALAQNPADDWRRHPIVSATTDDWDWRSWCRAAGADFDRLDAAHRLDTDNAATEAVIAGLGIALVTVPLALDALHNGLLHPVPGTIAVHLGTYCLTTRRREPRASVRAFATWLEKAAAKSAAETHEFLKKRGITCLPDGPPEA